MKLTAFKTELKEIQSFRELFLHENNFQIRYNACHERGWSDSYLLIADDIKIGYGSVKGKEIPGRDTIFEFYIIPPFRNIAGLIFKELIKASHVTFIECQSNEKLLTAMLYEFSQNIHAGVILFEDHIVTDYTIPGIHFRPVQQKDKLFHHQVEPAGEFVLEREGEVVATGGFYLHYNKPFADLYMEVKEDNRRMGLGSLLIQELKKACYLAGRVPSARCNIENTPSKATLLKAGMKVCGFMLNGKIKNIPPTDKLE